MKIILYLFITILLTSNALACGNEQPFNFEGYSGLESFGESVSKNNNTIINLAFIDELIKNPTGRQLQKNRDELFYLIARGDIKALHAGLLVFINLLKNPVYYAEYDAMHEAWTKEELAFAISRSFDIHDAMCKLSYDDWNLAVDFYEETPDFWGIIYDPP